MRIRFNTTVTLLVALGVILCGCGGCSPPLGKVEVPTKPETKTVRIYVCGAVEHEGYYEVKAGTDYYDVFRLAGILPQSAVPTLSSPYVDGSVTNLIVDFYDGSIRYSSVNANSVLIAMRQHVDGLSDRVVAKLADYLDQNGKITNKHQLELALGGDYADNFYKLFIAEIDYEEID